MQETLHFVDYDFEPHHFYTGLAAVGVTLADFFTKRKDRQDQDRYKGNY